MSDLVKIKNKIIEKINTLSSTANPRELTFMSKSLERLNSALPEQMVTNAEGYVQDEVIDFNQSTVPPMPVNLTRAGIGAKGSPAEFAIYSQHSWIRATFQNYGENLQANDSNLWHWCHHHTGSRGGGVWGFWSTAQRNHCSNWGGNNYCYFPTSGSPADSGCYTTGSDAVGPLGHSGMWVGAERGFGITWTHNCYQSTGRAPRHELRNENHIVGNYECSDKESYLAYDKQTIYLRSKRVQPGAGPSGNYSQKSTNCGDTNSYGSLSHNADRGELAVMNLKATQVDGYNEQKMMHEVKLWKQVPTININTNLATYMNNANSWSTFVRFDGRRDSNITPTWINSEGGDTSAWGGDNPYRRESQSLGVQGQGSGYFMATYDPNSNVGGPDNIAWECTDNRLVITNNGDIYYGIHSRYNHTIHRTKRYRDPTTNLVDDTYYESIFVPEWNHENHIKNVSGIDEYRRRNIVGYQPIGCSAVMLDALYLEDACGRNEGGGASYGNAGTSNGGAGFNIMSRNKKNVLMTSQYHRYGSGTATFLVDKRFNRWSTMAYLRDVNYGVHWGPFGKEGFVCSFNRNMHANNISTRVYIWRQNTNSGMWSRCDMSRALAFHNHCDSNFPAMIPNDY